MALIAKFSHLSGSFIISKRSFLGSGERMPLFLMVTPLWWVRTCSHDGSWEVRICGRIRRYFLLVLLGSLVSLACPDPLSRYSCETRSKLFISDAPVAAFSLGPSSHPAIFNNRSKRPLEELYGSATYSCSWELLTVCVVSVWSCVCVCLIIFMYHRPFV